MVTREQIFRDPPFAQCHASTLAVLAGGRIVAAWFAGSREGQPDVAIWGAVRDGGAWTPPRILADVRAAPHWNPVLFAADGDLHLFFKVGDRISRWETWCAVSRDGGETWSTPKELCPGDRGGRGPVKNKPILLSDGAWLAPASLESARRWDLFVDRSEDGGCTWQASAPVAIDRRAVRGKGAIQPTLWESRPGRVHMLARSTCGRICRSDSTDGGRTWSRLEKTDLPNNNSGIDLVSLEGEGAPLVLVYNPREGNWAPRTPLSVAVSLDGGRIFERRLDLETEKGEFSYPSVVAEGDGVAITWTANRRAIGFWRGALEDLQ